MKYGILIGSIKSNTIIAIIKKHDIFVKNNLNLNNSEKKLILYSLCVFNYNHFVGQ